jgi:hypothetical protein
MRIKEFIVILGLSVVVWYGSRIAQALVELTILETSSVSFYSGTSVVETGYPIALNISKSDSMLYFYYGINVIIWFFAILGLWKLFLHLKKTSKSSKK